MYTNHLDLGPALFDGPSPNQSVVPFHYPSFFHLHCDQLKMSAIDPPPPAMPTVGPNELTGFGVRTIVITLIFTLVATISVFGRFGARFLNGVKPLLEDWLVVVALIFTWGYAAGNIICEYSVG